MHDNVSFRTRIHIRVVARVIIIETSHERAVVEWLTGHQARVLWVMMLSPLRREEDVPGAFGIW